MNISYWHNMKREMCIYFILGTFLVCKKVKFKSMPLHLYPHLPIPSSHGHDLHMNRILGLPRTKHDHDIEHFCCFFVFLFFLSLL